MGTLADGAGDVSGPARAVTGAAHARRRVDGGVSAPVEQLPRKLPRSCYGDGHGRDKNAGRCVASASDAVRRRALASRVDSESADARRSHPHPHSHSRYHPRPRPRPHCYHRSGGLPNPSLSPVPRVPLRWHCLDHHCHDTAVSAFYSGLDDLAGSRAEVGSSVHHPRMLARVKGSQATFGAP